MCFFQPKSQPAPPAPTPVSLPAAPRIEEVSSTKQMQKTPANPKGLEGLFARRGKRGMVIQLGATAGTNIPGTGK